ncbi:hypothetical protein JRO89_XS01G0313400 [Xanthoceras sorbifolium]|uniref:Protein kinase domain-containing protein n=1 Tax=Xanthoceras sorbifolium TaxID=99658 RepID=A0ABQ8INJ9_9ROSI|nr:hypothetical protein JRO89_XS01G0313400 [Xanthoceras sorbifolium]
MKPSSGTWQHADAKRASGWRRPAVIVDGTLYVLDQRTAQDEAGLLKVTDFGLSKIALEEDFLCTCGCFGIAYASVYGFAFRCSKADHFIEQKLQYRLQTRGLKEDSRPSLSSNVYTEPVKM